MKKHYYVLTTIIIAIVIIIISCVKLENKESEPYDPWAEEEYDPWEGEEEEEPTIIDTSIIPEGQTGLNQEENWKANRNTCYIKNGKFYQDGKWRFLKIAKPLSDFSTSKGCNNIANNLKKYKELNYDCIELNCYWYQFDKDGDGTIDVSLNPLIGLMKQIYAEGMFPCLTVETYSVGGGQMPSGFWDLYPDAAAQDEYGNYIRDDEYGFSTAVVSICHEGYRMAARKYITNLVNGLGTAAMRNVLWFETTVEPQFMGNHNICYSQSALDGYNKWRSEKGITSDAMPTKSDGTPDYGSDAMKNFVNNATWNKYRAYVIAEWISGDAKTYKEAYESLTHRKAYVAVDYLDAGESSMRARVGNPEEMLSQLENVDIIQINWTYNLETKDFNQKAFDRVNKAKVDKNRDWAITEHMTFNGSDYGSFSKDYTFKHLSTVIANNTRFGFEFVNTCNGHESDSFQCYNSNWVGSVPLCYVEEDWTKYLNMIWNTQINTL